MAFNSNNIAYRIATDNEVSTVLSRFNTHFIIGVIDDNLEYRYKPYSLPLSNLVLSLETNFKITKDQYPANVEQIEQVRIDTYKEIIERICMYYNIEFIDNVDMDYYSAAYYIYDFLVSRFNSNVTSFFCNYIFKERNNIYDMLNLITQKRNKDSSTLYGKKAFKNPKIATIYANLELVLANISAFDISLETILTSIYSPADRAIVSYLLSILAPKDDLFKTAYVSFISNDDLRPVVITNIRLSLQKIAGTFDGLIINKNDEGEL